MPAQEEITQRDLRHRSKEIMDAVENGHAAVVAVGRKPRRRTADLMIASTATAEDLPLFTTNPDDFAGLDRLLTIVPVTRPPVPQVS